jgi:hypothetical protein
MNDPRIQPPGSPSEADAIVAACEAWPTVSGYVRCHYREGCGCEMVPARVRAAIAALGQATVATPPASDLERARNLLADDPDEMDEDWLASIIAAVRAEAKAEQHAADVAALRRGAISVEANKIADFLEKRGVSVSS